MNFPTIIRLPVLLRGGMLYAYRVLASLPITLGQEAGVVLPCGPWVLWLWETSGGGFDWLGAGV